MKHHLTNELLKILCYQDKEKIKYTLRRDFITFIDITNKKTKEELEIYISNDQITIDGEELRAQMRAESAIRYTINRVIEFCKD